jgi:hypothetical protein
MVNQLVTRLWLDTAVGPSESSDSTPTGIFDITIRSGFFISGAAPAAPHRDRVTRGYGKRAGRYTKPMGAHSRRMENV